MEKTNELLNQKQSSRLPWIDVVKGIGIWLVAMGHITVSNFLNDWIYSFHMPMFFALSGLLWSFSITKNISFKDYFIKKVKTILFPFILFRALLALYWLVVERRFRELDIGPIWFLIILFFVEVVCFLIINKRDSLPLNIGVLIGAGVGLCLLVYFEICQNRWLNWFVVFFSAMFWYQFGNVVGLITKKAKIELNNKILCAMCILVLFAVTVVVTIYNGNVSMFSSVYNNIVLYFVGSVAGYFLIILLSKYVIKKCKPLEWYGKNTIIILATHDPIKRVVLKASEVVLNKLNIAITVDVMQNTIWMSLLVLVAVMIIEIFVIYIFKFLKSKTKGNLYNWLAFIQ